MVNLVHSLRLTAFLPKTPETPWKMFAGSDPDVRTSVRDQGKMVEIGALDVATLSAVSSPRRVDWSITPTATPEPHDVLGPLKDWLGPFRQGARQVLVALPNVTRVAVGVVLVEEVETREDGYRRLRSLLKTVTIYPESTSDLYYQINHPLHEPDHPPLNRILKFAVSQQQSFQVGADGSISGVGGLTYAVRFELDFSSAQAPAVVSDAAATFDKLMTLAEDAAERGEYSCL